jgi:hypothetical protein
MQKQTHSGRGHDGRGNPENLVPQFSELAHALKGIELPQDKEGVRRVAEDNGADDEIIQMIENLPDQKYTTMADIIGAAGDSSSQNMKE